jgi:aryl-alcohol dehydrogenase-like predicted oxidoreductase
VGADLTADQLRRTVTEPVNRPPARLGELSVSAMGLGCNQLGTTCDAPTSRAIVQAALDAGVTFFDTADEYGDGASEEMLGTALAHRRDEVVIATKFGGGRGERRRMGAHPDWIAAAVQESLARLHTDRIDLYQLHFPDPDVPIEETLGALHELVTAGTVREIGCANFTGRTIKDAAAVASRAALTSFASAQNRLNLLRRESLQDVIPACDQLGLRFLPFFPLAAGVLTGKYERGHPPRPGSRLGSVPPDVAERILSPAVHDQVDALTDFAVQRGRTIAELAIAWLLTIPPVASVIAGATSAEQVRSNVAASSWHLTEEDMTALAALLDGPV